MKTKKELTQVEINYLLDHVWALNEMLEQYIEEKEIEGIDRHALTYYRVMLKEMEGVLMTNK